MNEQPKALILEAPGINCDKETAFAFEQAGASAEGVHISQLISGEVNMQNYQILGLSGGFSYGDHIASGRILGLELQTTLAADLNQFVEAEKPVLGICNGFQVLVETGLLPNGEVSELQERPQKVASLVTNERQAFDCRWGKLRVADGTVCRFIPDYLQSEVVELPSAHGEGRFVSNSAQDLHITGQVVLQFCDDKGQPTESYPQNPNGSPDGITAICDPRGVVLGMMPHPERAVLPTQHPNWRRGEGHSLFGDTLFRSIVNYAKEL